MDILSQLTSDFISSLLAALTKPGEDFGQRMLRIQQSLNQIVCIMISYLLSRMDDVLAMNPAVKKDWKCERIDSRTLQTVLGTVTYRRRYYIHRETGQREHLLDDQLGISKWQRVSNDTRQAAVELAVEQSYASSGEKACPGGISKMSVSRYIGELEAEGRLKSDGILRLVENVYVEADEDHVALQNGKTEQVWLVYVHDGIEERGGRNNLKHARYLVWPKGRSTDELWECVLDYIESQYDLDVLKRVFLSGDGASWIRAGAEYLPGCVSILDGFHVRKALMSLTAGAPEHRATMTQALDKGDEEGFRNCCREVIKRCVGTSERERKTKLAGYLLGHWQEIRNRKEPGAVGCSAEGHVSHILSARLSSRPLGWGENNLYTIAQLRTMKANGETISYLELTRKNKKMSTATSLNNTPLRKVRHALIQSEPIFHACIPILDNGKTSPLYQTLNSLAFASLVS